MLLTKATLILLSFAVFSTDTCKKHNKENNLSKTKILISNNWQVDEVLRNKDGVNSHYIRNGINTTGTNYNVVRISFNKDGTGTYTADNEETYNMSWQFSSKDERNMRISVDYGNTTTYNWNMVEISPTALTNTTALSTYEGDVLVTARFIPVQ